MLPNASKTDFNSSLFHVDLWAALQEPLSMTLRCHTHIATLGNAHWPTVLLNFSMISILTLKSTLLLLLCGHPVSCPPVSVNYVICLLLFANRGTPQKEDLLCLNCRYSIHCNWFFIVPTTPPYLNDLHIHTTRIVLIYFRY